MGDSKQAEYKEVRLAQMKSLDAVYWHVPPQACPSLQSMVKHVTYPSFHSASSCLPQAFSLFDKVRGKG
eukprot:111288-Pelagomonas_calceolata.AAC.2